jgi:hypothetical protein
MALFDVIEDQERVDGRTRLDPLLQLTSRAIGGQGSTVVLASIVFLVAGPAVPPFFAKGPPLLEEEYLGGSFPAVGWGVVGFEPSQPRSDSERTQASERRKSFFIDLGFPGRIHPAS